MKLSLNGEVQSFPERLTIAELVKRLRIETPAVAVEVNRTIVPKSTYLERELRDGDEVEIVTFVGGG